MTSHGVEKEKHTFKCLLNIDGFLGTSLKVRDVAFGLTESHGAFRRNHSLVLFHIDLVAQHNLVK